MRSWCSLRVRLFRGVDAAGILVAVLGLLPGLLSAAERWQMQYFFDEAKRTFNIRDMAFPTAQRGIAVGAMTGSGGERGAAVLTTDGGAHWTSVPLPAPAFSVFFLDDSLGWVVTPKGVYRTEEGGRSWRKIDAPKETLRVCFLDRDNGFAVGMKKSVYRTVDGGKRWTRVAAADAVKGRPEYTVYNWITFVSPKVGVITGFNRPPRRSDGQEFPDWMDPEGAADRREWPHMSISLETHDGGQNRKASTESIFGSITRVRMNADAVALWLVEHVESFEYPSEVLVNNRKTGKTGVFRNRERAITDVAVTTGGPAYMVAIEVPGKSVRLPVPGKLHILSSDDLARWREMDVDYRATARRAVLGWADARNVWVGTDTGMILKLVHSQD